MPSTDSFYVVGRLYRLSPMMDDPALRKRAVVFKGWLERPFDIRRAVVSTVETARYAPEELLVNPHYIISL